MKNQGSTRVLNKIALNLTTETLEKSQRACLDPESQKTVKGEHQAKSYCRYMETKFRPTKTKNTYKFRNDLHKSQGRIIIKIRISDAMVVQEPVDVTSLNVSFLIGLDLLQKYKETVDNVHNKLICYAITCEIP